MNILFVNGSPNKAGNTAALVGRRLYFVFQGAAPETGMKDSVSVQVLLRMM